MSEKGDSDPGGIMSGGILSITSTDDPLH